MPILLNEARRGATYESRLRTGHRIVQWLVRWPDSVIVIVRSTIMNTWFVRANRLVLGFAVASGLAMFGCANSAQTGSLVGAAVGAAAGQWIGKDTGGTLIGAGVGAAAGYMIGNEQDKADARQQDIDDDQP